MKYNRFNGNKLSIILSICLVAVISFYSYKEYKNNREQYKGEYVLNKELERQIINYKKHIYDIDKKLIEEGYSITFHVFHRELNDSLDRFAIMPCAAPEIIEDLPYQCIINIDGTDTFFHFAMYNHFRSNKTKYIRLSDKSYMSFMKRYHHKTFESIKKYGYIYPQLGYEQEILYLTFKNDSLIDTDKGMGLADDRVPVHLDGKIVSM